MYHVWKWINRVYNQTRDGYNQAYAERFPDQRPKTLTAEEDRQQWLDSQQVNGVALWRERAKHLKEANDE